MKQNELTAVVDQRENDGYAEFAQGIQRQFNVAIVPPSDYPQLFTTNVQGLWEAFLSNLPDEGRQHYNCNCCRHFIQRFGGLVRVTDKGVKVSAIWNADQPKFFQQSVNAMLKLIQASEIDGVFVSSESVYGQPVTGEWHHMHVVPALSQVWRTEKPNAYQHAAALGEDYKVLSSALAEYNEDVVNQALKLLQVNALYRGEKVLGAAKWFKAVQDLRKAARKNKDNVTWLAVVDAPAGFCHVKNLQIGTLLDDLKDGLDFQAVTARFKAKMAQYQRSQVDPSAGNIQRGEEIIAEMGAGESLQRRYATFKDIKEYVWQSQSLNKALRTKSGSLMIGDTVVASTDGVFSNITPRAKAKKAQAPQIDIPAMVVTWMKFSTMILPSAKSIELKVPATSERFAALVTAVNVDAPPILQWDDIENRNPVSWYYGGGVDAEIRRRVLDAGGQYEDVDIRASLIWNNRNDLDLHVFTPQREEIWYRNKRASCGGYLDTDMNVKGETETPVENTRWGRGQARQGRYVVFVQNYRGSDRAGCHYPYSNEPTPFKVELQVKKQFFSFEGVIPGGAYGDASNIIAFEFDYMHGYPVKLLSAHPMAANPENNWNVTPNAFVPVTGIVLSPNLWGKQPMEQHGKHVFFLLQDCRDVDGTQARGFFSEALRSEFREIRSVLEAYNVQAGVDGSDNAQACGVGMSTHNEWNLILRVTDDSGVMDYKLDRWD